MVKGTILVASPVLSGRKLRLLTQREDTTVVFFDTSREALEYLIENTPEFVVLDQALESVAGLEIIRKIRKVERLYQVPVALLSFTEKLELTPPDKKLIDLHIEKVLTEAELLETIHQFEEETDALKKTQMDMKSTMFLEQAISQLGDEDIPDPDEGGLTQAQQMMLSPSQKVEYLQAEVERLNAMIAEYQERFGDIYAEELDGKKPWLDVLLKPVF